jgi:hypothetical protein
LKKIICQLWMVLNTKESTSSLFPPNLCQSAFWGEMSVMF